VLAQADKIVLGVYLNAREVGIYAVAMALVGFVPVVLQSVNQIFSPTISELHAAENKLLLQRLYSTLTKWILVLTIPMALTLLIFSNSLMGVFGSDFRAGSMVLAIGTVGQLLNCAVGSVGYLLLMSGHQKRLVGIQAASAVTMVLFLLLLVPRYGLAGAAIGTAAGVAITNAWSLLAVRRTLGMVPYTANYLRLIVPTLATGAGLLMLARLSAASFSDWQILAMALLTSYLLFSSVFVATGLDSQDRIFLRSAWEKLWGRTLWSYE
jgi:O-antigen/teichoic acid export membrane protein